MTNTIKNIVLPFKFNDASLNALNTAVQMCKRHSAKLHVVHVVQPEMLFPTAGMQAPVAALAQEMNESETNNLKQLTASVTRNHAIQCELHLEGGLVPYQICQVANVLNADLIVMGTNAEDKRRCFISDSIAYMVMHDAQCPVLTVPKTKTINSFKKIVFPVRPALNALKKFNTIRPILLRNNALMHIIGIMNDEKNKYINMTRKLVDDFLATTEKENIAASYQFRYGKNPAKMVLNASEELSADLVVITASTKRNFRQFFFGNYTQNLMRNNSVAVLCVKPNGVKRMNAGDALYNTVLL